MADPRRAGRCHHCNAATISSKTQRPTSPLIALPPAETMLRTRMTTQEPHTRAIELTLVRMRTNGVEKVRLRDVARKLGVSYTALYAHFADKAELLDAVTEQG